MTTRPSIRRPAVIVVALPLLCAPIAAAVAQSPDLDADKQRTAASLYNDEGDAQCGATGTCAALLPALPAGTAVRVRQIGCTIAASKGAQVQYVDISAAPTLLADPTAREILSAPLQTGESTTTTFFVLHSGSLLGVTEPDRIRIRVLWVNSSLPSFSRWHCTVSGQFIAP
jgi:hypothetical protein